MRGRQRSTNACAQTALPAANALDGRAFPRRRRRPAPELVRILDLLEKLDGVLDAIHAELQRIHVQRAEFHRRLAVRGERTDGGERKIRVVFALAEARRGCRQQKEKPGCENCLLGAYHRSNAFLKMFQRNTPRNVRFPGTGRHSG